MQCGICTDQPLQDGKSKGVSLSDDEKKLFPLPDDHWINQPVRIRLPNWMSKVNQSTQ